MGEQQAFSRLLYDGGHGIALLYPTQGIEVGDLCYWDVEGTPIRILNVFDNTEVSLLMTRDGLTMVLVARRK